MLLERGIVVSYEAPLVWVRSSLLRSLLLVCNALMPLPEWRTMAGIAA